MMEVALRIKERNWALQMAQGGFSPNRGKVNYLRSPFASSPSYSSPKSPPSIGSRVVSTRKAAQPMHLSFKWLSKAKLQPKKEKGLCFHCDEKYTVEHICKNKELQVLIIQDEEGRR